MSYKYGLSKQAGLTQWLRSNRTDQDSRDFRESPAGSVIFNLFDSIPSTYTVKDYKVPAQTKQPIRLVFSGMGDGDTFNFAKQGFLKKYKDKPVFVFGRDQYQQAMKFADQMRDKPMIVYGYSWGSPVAKNFIENYQGNIIAAHFLDPMRHDIYANRRLDINRDIPITYTKAGHYQNLLHMIKNPFLDALRYSPNNKMYITQSVANHGSLQDWLNVLQAQDVDIPKPIQKAASLTGLQGNVYSNKQVQTFRNNPLGAFAYNFLQAWPSTVAGVRHYKLKGDPKQPVRIIFSGNGDGGLQDFAQSKFNDHYGTEKPIYIFGRQQYDQAMQFAKQIDPQRPVIAYGYSWGGPAARKFIETYPGNLVAGHFLDPMRQDVFQPRNFKIKRDVPITYTKAGPYGGWQTLKNLFFKSFHYNPQKDQIQTQPTQTHGSMAQWLDILQRDKLDQPGEQLSKLHELAKQNAAKKAPKSYKYGEE